MAAIGSGAFPAASRLGGISDTILALAKQLATQRASNGLAPANPELEPHDQNSYAHPAQGFVDGTAPWYGRLPLALTHPGDPNHPMPFIQPGDTPAGPNQARALALQQIGQQAVGTPHENAPTWWKPTPPQQKLLQKRGFTFKNGTVYGPDNKTTFGPTGKPGAGLPS